MKLTNEMLLASNWKKYMINVDREESWDIIKDQVIEYGDYTEGEDDLAEMVEELLDLIEDRESWRSSCFWSLDDMEGLEGEWMGDYASDQIWNGEYYNVLWQFVEKEDHEVCDYIVDVDLDGEVWINDAYDDIYQKLVDMNVIEYQ